MLLSKFEYEVSRLNNDTVLLKEIWIPKEKRNKGLGKLFMEALEKKCKQAGVKRVQIYLPMPLAWNFYNRLGYCIENSWTRTI